MFGFEARGKYGEGGLGVYYGVGGSLFGDLVYFLLVFVVDKGSFKLIKFSLLQDGVFHSYQGLER